MDYRLGKIDAMRECMIDDNLRDELIFLSSLLWVSWKRGI